MATVLHIEDDAASRLLVSKVLSAAGHEVVDAESGLEGIRLAAARRPDIVLVDIPATEDMPKGKALDLMQSSPVMGFDSKVIGTTGCGDSNAATRLFRPI